MSHAPDAPASEAVEAILGHFGSLMRHVAGWHATDFLGLEVTMSQAKCLYVVSLRPGIGMSALAEQLGVGLSSASGLVDRLVEHGYLERHEDPSDRRQQQVLITPAGAAVVERIRELNAGLLRRLLAGLTIDQLTSLREGMAALDQQARTINQADIAATSATPRKDQRMIRLTQFALREKSVMILLAVGIFLAGIYSWGQLRQELIPDIELPFVTVITPLPGAGAEDVASQVTEPIERSLANVPRMETMQSSSSNSLSLVFAQFDFGTDLKETIANVESAVAQAELPEGIEPQVSSFDFNSQPIIVATVGPADGRRSRGGRGHHPRRGRAGPPGHRGRLHGRADRRRYAHPGHRPGPGQDGRVRHLAAAGAGHPLRQPDHHPVGVHRRG